MAWVIVCALALFILAPLLGLFSQIQSGLLSEVLRSPSFLKSLGITLLSGGGAAFLSCLIGVSLARPFSAYQWRGKRIQRLLLLLPYLIPNFILAIAFVVAWNPVTGLLNRYVSFPFGLYGFFGMTILFAIVHMPVAFLLAEKTLVRVDHSLKEAARISGATPSQVFYKIELPLLWPTLMSAFGLCFALNISAFAIPAWIGAPEKVYPLTYKIYQAIQLGGLEGIPQAASLSLVLFVLAFLPPLTTLPFQNDEKKYVLLSGKSAKVGFSRQSWVKYLFFQIYYWLIQTVFWLAPLTCLALGTVVKPGCLQTNGLQCLSEISFDRYWYVVFGLTETKSALHGSLVYGAISCLIIFALSALILILLSQKRFALKISESLIGLPLATPGAIIALGLIVVYSGKYTINLYNTPWIVVVAYVIKHMSLAFQPLRTGLSNISPSLIEVARLSGAQTNEVWKKIVLPILKPEFLGGFFLVFIPIIGELTMSVFLTSPSFRSIGTVLFDLQDYADQASAGALAILLVLLILAFNEMARLFSRGRLGY